MLLKENHIFQVKKFSTFLCLGNEIKRYLLLERKAITNLDSILKNRDITLPTEVHIVKAMVFSVVMDVKVRPSRKLNVEEFTQFSNCSVGEDS